MKSFLFKLLAEPLLIFELLLELGAFEVLPLVAKSVSGFGPSVPEPGLVFTSSDFAIGDNRFNPKGNRFSFFSIIACY
jgi:hypothetical protein